MSILYNDTTTNKNSELTLALSVQCFTGFLLLQICEHVEVVFPRKKTFLSAILLSYSGLRIFACGLKAVTYHTVSSAFLSGLLDQKWHPVLVTCSAPCLPSVLEPDPYSCHHGEFHYNHLVSFAFKRPKDQLLL